MPVTNITVRFSRKVQVRQFEPMEAEITAHFVVDEGEEIPSAASFLIETKDAVMQGLRHKAAQAIEAADDEAEMPADEPTPRGLPAGAREAGKPAPGKRRRTAAEVAEDAAKLADIMDGGDPNKDASPQPEHPDLDPANHDLNPEVSVDVEMEEIGPDPATVAASGPDLSDFDAPAETVADISDAELLKIATSGVPALTAEGIRKLITGFGAKQLVQLDADQRATFQAQVTDAIAAAKS